MARIRNVFRWRPGPAKDSLLAAARNAAHEMADFMAARAVDYAPVDTGFMSFRIQVIEVGAGNDIGYRVVSPAAYSRYVEFGHMAGSGTWVAPNPFMRRALADAQAEWPAIVGRNRVGAGGNQGHDFLGTTFTT